MDFSSNGLTVVLAVACVALIILYFRQKKKLNAGYPPEGEAFDADQPVKDVSLRDRVTGLYNHAHLLRRLGETMAKVDRSDEKMGLVLWDIDGFVDFNNKYGQKEGDIFLRKVADVIRKTLRSYDEAFRRGPDEFCAILSPADENIARRVTDRVSEAVSTRLFRDVPEYANEKFSISAGVVYYPSENRLPEALLYAAGEALFKNKAEKK